MGAREITKIGKKWVKVRPEDWEIMWNMIGASLDEANVAKAGGVCDGFCGAVCADHDGCDLSFGTRGDCGALCQDGSVLIQAT